MCGIIGILTNNSNLDNSFSVEIKKMANAISHRGPDAEGFHIDPIHGIYLGHRRLSILDLTERGNQPLSNEDDTILLVFNGEIYNYLELFDILKEGHVFKSRTDSEVLVHGYEEWGIEGLLERIRGMFAFGIKDKRRNKFFLARDRIGIKPVYYMYDGDTLIFSSEIKSFFALDRSIFKPELDVEQARLLVFFMFLPDNHCTIIRHVKKLEPAHYLEFNNTFLTKKRYWELKEQEKYKNISYENALKELERLLLKVTSEHLISDVPIGIMLSGGLDSSLLTAMIKRIVGDRSITTITAKFDHELDESKFAKIVADYLNTNHIELKIDLNQINKDIDDYIWYFDDLSTLDGGLITTKLLCEKVSKLGIKVLLLGEGSDEAFGGYSWYGLSQIPFKYFPLKIQCALYYYIISRNLLYQFSKGNSILFSILKSRNARDIFRKVTKTEIEYQLPNHLLMKVDKGTMSQSIEARVPFLDHELVEFLYSLPRNYKLHGDIFNYFKPNEKFILREVAETYLPIEIAARKKRGFMLPMNNVLDCNIDKVKRRILRKNSISRIILGKKVENLFKSTRSRIIKKQNEFMLWRLFLLETWYLKYFGDYECDVYS